MPRKPKPPPDDPEQFKRFIDMAREVGADTDPETLGRVFDKVARPSKATASSQSNPVSGVPDQTTPSSKTPRRRIRSVQTAKRS
jgi:hypothetical protein